MVMGDFNFPKIDWKNWLTKGDKISENFVSFVVGFCIHMWYIFVFCLIELGHKNVKLLPSIFSF
jgi:hypothetical protein